ncbi:MAG: discoidin domain-containing protein [Pirellulaceae bacterium]|jgi:cytochrome c553|nr:discoidin domain-containing protein [Pirellulaceae bacterium]
MSWLTARRGWIWLLSLLGCTFLSGRMTGATATEDPAVDITDVAVTPEQLERDWLQQAVVRTLPPTTPRAGTPEDAAGGCDGVIDGRYGFHTAEEERPWWQVDLGTSLPLERIVIYNRGDGVSQRAAHLQVRVSDNGQDWRTLYEHDGTVFWGFGDQQPLCVTAGEAVARFVRIELPGRTYLHLDEVEVYADSQADNVALHRPAEQSSVSGWSTWHPRRGVELVTATDYPVAEVVRRGLALADDLHKLGLDVRDAEAALQAIAAPGPAQSLTNDPAVLRAQWLEAHRVIRQLALRNPLLDFDDLLLVKRVPGSFTHMSDQYYGWFSRPGGGLYVLEGFKTDAPRLRLLTAALPRGSILRPDVSHDAQRVLFAHCQYYPGLAEEPNKLDKANVPEDAFYHLYEMNLDGTGLRRLTGGKYDDFDGRYLPDGRIVFLSTRRGQAVQATSDTNIAQQDAALPDCYVRCGGGPERPVAVYTLHVLDPGTGHISRISPFEMFEWTPSVDEQGQILYARWDYVDRHNMPYMSLWSTLPDGTDARAVYGNYTQNPHCIFEARRVPGSRKIIFTGSGHHAQTGGPLVLLDPNRGADGEVPLQRLTPEVVFPESEGWPQTYFASPYPLSENHYLVAWSAAPLPPGTPRPHWGMPGPENDLGIYLFDAFGNLNLVYRDPAISSMDPLPIRPRTPPPQIASRVDSGDDSAARMLVVDVYQGLSGIPRGTIKQLRLVGIPAKTHPTMNAPQMGITLDDPGKFVIGTVPVQDDGSAHFWVPAGVSFFLQALDADGMAVQTMRSATYLQPGQTASCIGCHEPRNTAPPDAAPLAALVAPSKITNHVPGSWPLDYTELVQPVLEARCVSCHQPGGEGASFDLTPTQSYASLVAFGSPSLQDHVRTRYTEGKSTAGSGAARTNPLWKLLAAGHYDVQLDDGERTRLIVWMDTYGQRAGSFDAQQSQQLRELRQRMAAANLLTDAP